MKITSWSMITLASAFVAGLANIGSANKQTYEVATIINDPAQSEPGIEQQNPTAIESQSQAPAAEIQTQSATEQQPPTSEVSAISGTTSDTESGNRETSDRL